MQQILQQQVLSPQQLQVLLQQQQALMLQQVTYIHATSNLLQIIIKFQMVNVSAWNENLLMHRPCFTKINSLWTAILLSFLSLKDSISQSVENSHKIHCQVCMTDRLCFTCHPPVSSAAATPRILQEAAGTTPPPAPPAAAAAAATCRQQAEQRGKLTSPQPPAITKHWPDRVRKACVLPPSTPSAFSLWLKQRRGENQVHSCFWLACQTGWINGNNWLILC